MSRNYTPVTDALAAYVREVSLREPEALKVLRERTEDHPHSGWQIAPEQGQLLHFVARLTGARRVLEVGAFMGYSSTWMALAMPPGGTLVACDFSPEYAAIARRTWREAGVEEKIDMRLAPALETLDGLIAAGQSGTFDLVFVDADKGNYLNYYERGLQLLRTGGVLAADNVLRGGAVADQENTEPDTLAIRAFNRALHGDPRIALTLTTMGDGITLACKL